MKRYRMKNDIWEEILSFFSHVIHEKACGHSLRLDSAKKKKRKWCREERSPLEIESLSVPLYSILYIEKRRNIWRILISIPSSHSASRLLENIWDNIFPAFSSRFSRLLLPIFSRFQNFLAFFTFSFSFSRIYSIIILRFVGIDALAFIFGIYSRFPAFSIFISFFNIIFHLISSLFYHPTFAFYLSYYFQVSYIRFRVTEHSSELKCSTVQNTISNACSNPELFNLIQKWLQISERKNFCIVVLDHEPRYLKKTKLFSCR